jgi:hypothetical protein
MGQVKTTVEIAAPLFNQVKALAAQEGLSFRLLVEEGLRAVVETRKSASVKPFRLRDGSFKGGRGLKAGVRWEDLTALAYENEAWPSKTAPLKR